MEENKNCCENKSCDKCCCTCVKACCFVKHHKCLRILIIIAVLMIVFCMGAKFGRMTSFYHDIPYERGMMEWKYKNNPPIQKDIAPKIENTTPETETPKQ